MILPFDGDGGPGVRGGEAVQRAAGGEAVAELAAKDGRHVHRGQPGWPRPLAQDGPDDRGADLGEGSGGTGDGSGEGGLRALGAGRRRRAARRARRMHDGVQQRVQGDRVAQAAAGHPLEDEPAPVADRDGLVDGLGEVAAGEVRGLGQRPLVVGELTGLRVLRGARRTIQLHDQLAGALVGIVRQDGGDQGGGSATGEPADQPKGDFGLGTPVPQRGHGGVVKLGLQWLIQPTGRHHDSW